MNSKTIAGAAAVLLAELVTGCSAANPQPAATTPGGCQPIMTTLQQVDAGDDQADAFNANELVVGFSTTSQGAQIPTIWQAGRGTQLPRPDGFTGGQAVALDDHGDVIGILRDTQRANHAFYWDGTAMTFLKAAPGSQGTIVSAINASGEISGAVADDNGTYHAARWTSYQAVPTLLARPTNVEDTFGQAINDAGTVGTTTDREVNGQDVRHPALWTADRLQMLAGIAGPGSVGEVLAVSATGQAAGDSAVTTGTDDPAFASHATVWDPSGTPHDLGALPGDNYSQILGLSTSGRAAGHSSRYDYTEHAPTAPAHAVVWSATGSITQLPLPNLPAALTESKAAAIDDKGTVVGYYRPPGQPSRAAIWTCALGH